MYNIKVVSNMLGIPAVTLRAWERRYGLTPTARTDSGHRLYSDRDVEDLRWLKQQTEERGLSISHAIQNLFEQKQKKQETRMERQEENQYPTFQRSIKEALLSYDSTRAHQLLDYAFSLFPHEVVFQSVLVPLLYELGKGWEEGWVSVVQEHFATQLLRQRIQQLWRVFSVQPHYGKVVAFCPGGERHELGLLMFCQFLLSQGIPVLYLGADTPLAEIENLAKEQEIRMLCISLTNAHLLNDVKHLMETVSRSCPALKWVLGGQAFSQGEEWSKWRIGSDNGSWNRWFAEVRVSLEKGDR